MVNDFSGDPNCVALFRFDGNAADGKGGNDLTAVNSPAYDSGDKKEGTHCLDLEGSSQQYAYRNDADLDAGFPGKSGGSETSFSICFWVKPESFPAYGRIICKQANGVAWSWGVYYDGGTGKIRFLIGYNNGNAYTGLVFGTALSAGRWYHIAVVYDAADNGMKIRIWDDYNGALLGSNATGTADGDMSPTGQPLMLGRDNAASTYYYDGKLDEVVFFNKALSDENIDAIRVGNYGAGVTEQKSADSGTGVDAVESLATPQAKSANDSGVGDESAPLTEAVLEGDESGGGIEALISRLLGGNEDGGGTEDAEVGEAGQLRDSADEAGEGADRLVAKIERPVKGGGMKLWT